MAVSQFMRGDAGRRTAAPLVLRPAGRLQAFRWYGGKYSHLNWLLELLPADVERYCEPFGGSAAVLLNRAPSPVETYNDLDGELVNFFRVLREHPRELIGQLRLTPFSREEFALACGPCDEESKLERARRFYVRAEQARTGLAQTASLGRWAYCGGTSRRGMSASVSRFRGKIPGLRDVAERLLRVQIENRPAVDLIELYDHEDTFFYLDPPYVHGSRTDSRAYAFEMSDDDHGELAAALQKLKGRFALSGYRSELMEELFGTWTRIDQPEKTIASSGAKRQESLWLNYDPAA